MAVKVVNRNGKTVTLLNPAEKGRKYAAEMRAGIHATNDRKVKRDGNGKAKRLTAKERAYRAGYLDARKDSAKAYKSNARKKRGGNMPVVVSYTAMDD